MPNINQNQTPFVDALNEYINNSISPFDVPGHHMGNVDNKLKDILGDMAFKADVNAPRGLDNLNHPTGVIKKAEQLMAAAYGAREAFFLVNGTTVGIQAMIMTVCKAKDKIILPRNCHKSAINALILSGAIPVFISPKFDLNLEIANQPTIDDYIKAMDENKDAKAIFVINPTYFGACLDLVTLVKEAHKRHILVLVDEAHGSHFAFNENGPTSAMKALADASSCSTHKTLGSLTQSSVLLINSDKISHYDILKTLNILNTTSPSNILIASLDAARYYMAMHGKERIAEIISLANYAKEKINLIPGFKVRDKKYFTANGQFDYDETKLVIELENINLTGFELYNLLKDKYRIQMELAEQYVVLAILAIGSKKEHIDNLILALKDISKSYYSSDIKYPKYKFNVDYPPQLVRPRSAYHAPLKKVKLEDAVGKISKEAIMVYPPGIPLIIPGEVFTKPLIEHIEYYLSTDATILSDYDDGYVSVIDEENWEKYKKYREELEND